MEKVWISCFRLGLRSRSPFFFLLCVLAEKAAALLRSETPMEREDVCGCAGLRQDCSTFHSVLATMFF